MQFDEIEPFLRYYKRIRERTVRVIGSIPHDKLEWTPVAGKFTFGDIIRHLTAIERYMFVENALQRPSRYPGHSKELADGYENVLSYFNHLHTESLKLLVHLSPEALQQKCVTPAGISITVWKWLRAMVEHEIHHRGQLYVYLSSLGITGPPLYGLTSEEVKSKSLPGKM